MKLLNQQRLMIHNYKAKAIQYIRSQLNQTCYRLAQRPAPLKDCLQMQRTGHKDPRGPFQLELLKNYSSSNLQFLFMHLLDKHSIAPNTAMRQ